MMKLRTGTKGKPPSTSTMRMFPRASECSWMFTNFRPRLAMSHKCSLQTRYDILPSARARVSRGLCHVAQLELLDLARGGFGQLGEHHTARAFEAGELLLAVVDDLGLGHLGARALLDEGARRLAPFGVGLRHHGGSGDGRMLIEHVLDLDGGDVLA